MSPEEIRKKRLKIKQDIPEDLSIAIKTFIQQAVIVGEYELDTMPSEYLNNLLSAFAKYPKYHDLMGELIKILNQYEKID